MPILEEISDSDDIDNMDMDIAEFDPSLSTPIAPARPKPSVTKSDNYGGNEPSLFPTEPSLFPNFTPEQLAEQQKDMGITDSSKFSEDELAKIKTFQVIYPCYFDKNRSHKEGRRVPLDMAVENPLAKTISDAIKQINLPIILELDKNHPQDFGNPGRVKVLLKEDGEYFSNIKTKRYLFKKIAEYLKRYPTTLEKLKDTPFPPELTQGFVPERIPRVKGFKMNDIVPAHSFYTMKHPMTKNIYDKEEAVPQMLPPQQPKQKIMKVRR